VWEHWFATEPNRFYEGVGSEITTAHFNRYKEDVQWMKNTGQNSFRISISWARMVPNAGVGEVHPKAIAFFRDLLTEM
ncbi:family 1 glycosylhydrolase, partial [Listeria monocytogenes]|uniref:family 1 glycosylhydrolase n=1 Tax=Listeria monocytogenes TaxID=1639 RepID=UPI001C8EA605